MSFSRGKNPGVGFVPAYEVSGVPFVTSSVEGEVGTTAVAVQFPFVTRWLEVVNTGGKPLRIGFSKNGVEGKGAVSSGSDNPGENWALPTHRNYFTLNHESGSNASTSRLELRCSRIFFATETGLTDFSLIAGLTTIPKSQLNLTGSEGFEGIG